MPKAFPAEFRRDVVAVARKSDASIAKIAKDFGISESRPGERQASRTLWPAHRCGTATLDKASARY